MAAALGPGDDVLVERPTYEPFLAVPRLFGANPHNPSGVALSHEEVLALAAVSEESDGARQGANSSVTFLIEATGLDILPMRKEMRTSEGKWLTEKRSWAIEL